jgi:glycosyltransferase involved in cell wall biosynthesis
MLSVVLTSYNYARFLPAALEGLAAQTRQPDELIVIDDHSRDDSVAVIASFLGRFRDARLVQNPDNLGAIANLNRGLELARGTVVFFAAADDVTYPTLLERGMGLLEAHPEAALFSARSDIIDVEGAREGTLATAIPRREPGFIGPDAIARQLMCDDSWLIGNTTLYRRDALVAAGGFAAELGSFCDGYVSRLLALRRASAIRPRCSARGGAIRADTPGRRPRIGHRHGSWSRRSGGVSIPAGRRSRLATRIVGRSATCSGRAASRWLGKARRRGPADLWRSAGQEPAK